MGNNVCVENPAPGSEQDAAPASTRDEIRSEFPELFELMSETRALGGKVMNSKPIVWDEANLFSKITVVFVSTNLHRLSSVELLCSHGQAVDAVGLLRTMFEDLVDFKYMQNDKTKAEDFANYDSWLRLKLGRVIERQGGTTEENMKKIKARNEELEAEWKKVKARYVYTGRDGKERVFSRWSGKGGVGEVAKKVGLESTHDYIWHSFSNFMHTSSLFSDQHVLGRDGDNVVISMEGSRDMIEEVARTATSIVLDILAVVNEEYSLNFKTRIDELGKRLQKPSRNGV